MGSRCNGIRVDILGVGTLEGILDWCLAASLLIKTFKNEGINMQACGQNKMPNRLPSCTSTTPPRTFGKSSNNQLFQL